MSPYLRHYAENFQSLFLDDEGLLRYHDPLAEGDDSRVLCIPAHLQADIVWAAPQLAAHRGVDCTMDKLVLSCHFPGMRKITRECTNGCLAPASNLRYHTRRISLPATVSRLRRAPSYLQEGKPSLQSSAEIATQPNCQPVTRYHFIVGITTTRRWSPPT